MNIPETNHVSLNAVATGTGSAVNLGGAMRSLRVYATFSADVSAGEVIVEEAPTTDYAGTWAEIGTLAFVDDGCATLAQAAGGVLAVRARITTTISGGASPTVTVRIVAV
jgi:hypothetical protein